jgi:hypothetical protein
MSWFKEEPRGTLVSLDPSKDGLSFHVWFPYTKSFVKLVREGDLIAVRNFASGPDNVYSVLEVASALPLHYALGSSSAEVERAFPGFVVEAAKNLRQDWEQETPEEETTKIRTIAIPTGIQLRFPTQGDPVLENDQSLPMIGEEAHLLTDTMMNQVVNRGLIGVNIPTISTARLVLNPQVQVHIKVDDLLRTHFGIFGFTGAGKSNLMSTIVSELVRLNQAGVKIVLFDLMSEYHPLLADVLHEVPNAFLLALDSDSVPGGEETVRYYSQAQVGNSTAAAQSITRTMLLPTELEPYRDRLTRCMARLLDSRKIRILDQVTEPPPAAEVFDSLRNNVSGNIGRAEGPIQAWIRQGEAANQGVITFDQLRTWANELEGYAQRGEFPSARTAVGVDGVNRPVEMIKMSPTGTDVVFAMVGTLRGMLPSDRGRPPERARLTEREVFDALSQDDNRPALFIVQCDRDDDLRNFSARLINRLFSRRRRQGHNRPLALFIYDEADEFIPRERNEESYLLSRAAAEVLARRGRKFGMGLGLATQRVAYLDTKILGQPHTYLASKLPRKYDRDTMAEAFGATDEVLNRALRFTKGQWLLVSFDAIGLQNVPVPVQFPNANERIRSHLERE